MRVALKEIRVLLVDDDTNLLNVTSPYIEKLDPDFNVTLESSAKKALEKLKHEHFDAIISDYHMPEMDGIEFLKEVRKVNPDMPFVMFTGKSREEIAIQALNLGATHYLTKGGNPKSQYTTLIHTVRNAVDHNHSRQALVESEERYRLVFDNASDGILVVNQDTRKISSANQSFCRMMGYSLEEILALSIENLHHEDHIQAVMDDFQAQSEGRLLVAAKIPMMNKNGNIFYADITASTVHLGGTHYQLGVFRDVTSRMELEEAQLEREEIFRMIAEGTSDVIFIMDMDLKRQYLSPSVFHLRGFTVEESMAQSLEERMPPDSIEKMMKVFGDALFRIKNEGRRVDPIKLELEMYRKDGTTVLVETSASAIYNENDEPEGIVGITRDISARKEAEDALRESEENHRYLYECIPDGVVAFDLEGNVSLCNEAAAEMFGYTIDEAIGLHLTKFTQPEFHEIAIGLHKRALEMGSTPTPKTPFIGPGLRKDGSTFYQHITSTVMYKDNEVSGLLSLIRDITNFYELEETLRRQKDELANFAHAMAHDLRSYIHSIVGFTYLIEETGKIKYAEDITRIARKSEIFLQRSLMLAKAGEVIGERTLISFDGLLKEIASAVLPENVTFKVAKLPKVRCDMNKTDQMLRNLLLNAIEHGNPKNITVDSSKVPGGISIRISNDGSPIPIEVRSKIFINGFTTKNEGGGLGLNIVKRIAVAHKWEIRLESTKKTTFSIFIPQKDIGT